MDDKVFFSRTLEAIIRLGLLLILVVWSFQIIEPFITPIIWGVIIAVAAFPAYYKIQIAIGDRPKIAATLFILVALVLLIVPTVMLAGTLVDSAKSLAEDLSDGVLTIPPPPQSIGTWPVIGEPLEKFWSLASVNLEAAFHQIGPQIKGVGRWLLSTAAGAGFGILQFVVAIIIAAVLMVYAKGCEQAAHAIAKRLTYDRGTDLIELAEATVRSVSRGILGVSFVQALLAGLGFLVASVPGAGLWALLCLILSIAQIGILPVIIPVIIYLFSTAEPFTAIAFLIWSIPVVLFDNVMKPIFLGRGVKTPMVIIFLGAIGGLLTAGIIGLFIGSVVLALSYELFLAWLKEDPPERLEQH